MEAIMIKMSVFLTVLLALFMVAPASAQVHIGVVGGLNLADIRSNDLEQNIRTETGLDVNIAKRTTFAMGGIVDYFLSENLALRMEPMYVQKGCKLELRSSVTGFQFDEDVTSKVGYLELPVMIKYAFGAEKAKPYILAGPSLGYMLSAKMVSGGEEEDIKNDIKDFDFGLNFGAGLSIPIETYSLFVEGRYALGLIDIDDDQDEPSSVKTEGIQFFAGITFPLGGR
jgi:opacity protein-like surface antigen